MKYSRWDIQIIHRICCLSIHYLVQLLRYDPLYLLITSLIQTQLQNMLQTKFRAEKFTRSRFNFTFIIVAKYALVKTEEAILHYSPDSCWEAWSEACRTREQRLAVTSLQSHGQVSMHDQPVFFRNTSVAHGSECAYMATKWHSVVNEPKCAENVLPRYW